MDRSPTTYRGASLMLTDMPGGVWTWTHDATDGHGTARSLSRAHADIDAHLARHAAHSQKVTPCPA